MRFLTYILFISVGNIIDSKKINFKRTYKKLMKKIQITFGNSIQAFFEKMQF